LGLKKKNIKLSLEWMIKAASHGHPLAPSCLGYMATQGHVYGTRKSEPNITEALRWYLSSKNNKLSQYAIKHIDNLLCRYEYITLKDEGTFHDYLEPIKDSLGYLLGENSMQVGLNNPEGGFVQNQFAIPQVGIAYQTVRDIEEEGLNMLIFLQETTPGFMINAVKLYVRNKKRLTKELSEQTNPPYVSRYVDNRTEYLTFGENNVKISNQFLDYLTKIDDKFKEADKLLCKDYKSYKRILQYYLDDLKETQLMGLKYLDLYQQDPKETIKSDLEETTKKFNEQKYDYDKMEPLLTKIVEKIRNEREKLDRVKEEIKAIISQSVKRRNSEFFEENLYLNNIRKPKKR